MVPEPPEVVTPVRTEVVSALTRPEAVKPETDWARPE